eukprot:9969012-Alexandrium_andersonii.AAC.1
MQVGPVGGESGRCIQENAALRERQLRERGGGCEKKENKTNKAEKGSMDKGQKKRLGKPEASEQQECEHDKGDEKAERYH